MIYKMNYGKLNRSEFVEKAVVEELKHATRKLKTRRWRGLRFGWIVKIHPTVRAL